MTGVEQRGFDPPPFPHQAVNKSLLWARAEDQPHFPTKLQFLLRLLEIEKKLLPSLSVSSSPATT